MSRPTVVESESLLPLVDRVLERYSFETRRVTHLASHSNVLFKVESQQGAQMVLRVGQPHANSRSNIEVEIAWLLALNAETDLELVAPIATTAGDFIVEAGDESLRGHRTCVLFSWVPGEAMGDGAGTFAYRQFGQTCAALQEHGAQWEPPSSISPRRWNRVFYYDPVEEPVILHDAKYDHLFDVARLAVINKAGVLAEKVIAEAWASSTPQIVHGDLHEWNVHLVGSRMYVFDFEDVMLATPEQDVATALYSSRQSHTRSDKWEAFRAGYESIRPWPIHDQRQLDSFHAARQVMLMNYAARTLPEREAASYLDSVMGWLKTYVANYT